MTLYDYMKIYGKSKNYIGIITYPDLSTEQRAQFKTLSTEHKYDGMKEDFEASAKFVQMTTFYHRILKTTILEMRKNDPNLSERDLGFKLHVSDSLIHKILKSENNIDSVESI